MPQHPVRNKPIPDDVWKCHKPEIIRLMKEHSLLETIEIMKKEHDFFAKKGQYISKLSGWGFKKNIPEDKLEEIVFEIEKRRAVGTASKVEWGGNTYSEETIMNRYSKKRPSTLDRLRKQNARSTVNDNFELKPRDFVVSTPTETGSVLPPQPPDTPDSTETHLPDIDMIDIRVDENLNPDNSLSEYHAYVEDTIDVAFDIPGQSARTGNPVYDIESDWRAHNLEKEEEEREKLEEKDLQTLISTGLQQLTLTTDAAGVISSQEDPMEAVVNYFQAHVNLDDMNWNTYARQKDRDYLDYIDSQKYEATKLIEFAESIAAFKPAHVLRRDAMDWAWKVIERDLNYEPLPHHVCKQILGDQTINPPKNKNSDNDWFTSMSTLLERNFSEMKSYTKDIRLVEDDHHLIPTISNGLHYGVNNGPSLNTELNTFDSVAIHLPRFISEYGMSHFFTAFALQETARYLCFSQQRSEPRTLSPAMSGTNQSSPAQKYPVITRILSQALVTYENAGMGDHPLAIECLEMLLSNTDDFDDGDPISEFLTTGVSGIPYKNYRRAIAKYGHQHPRTISAHAQLISFSLKLLESPNTRAQLKPGARRVTLWGWSSEDSIKAAFNPHFDAFLNSDSTSSSGNLNDLAKNLSSPTQPPLNSKARWQHIVRGNMFDIIQTFEDIKKFETAVKLLERMRKWKNAHSGWLERDEFQIDLTLGRIYGKMGDYKVSLQTLFDLAKKSNRPESRDWTWDAVREISMVATSRGPVLYQCIQPFLERHLERWKQSDRRYNYCYSTLAAIFSANQEKYRSVSTLGSRKQVPYPGLQNQPFHGQLDTPMADCRASRATDWGAQVWEDCNVNPY